MSPASTITEMREEAQPRSNKHSVPEHSRRSGATDVGPTSSLMQEDEDPKRETRFKDHAKKANRLWQDTWAPEVLSCLVALSALVGMATILKLRQGMHSY
jgi:hypothetical protein